jgi:hypothetical protein
MAALLASVALSGCGSGPAPTCGPAENSCLRVLFIGNSYTYVNDLPGTLAALARAQGKTAEVQTLATGGATLNDHLNDAATVPALESRKWDYVVLQEQSDTPSSSSGRDWLMFPAARALARQIEDRGEKPLFFMTWAHRDGDPSLGVPDYESMQRAVDSAYLSISNELDAPVAPVGVTWFVVRRQSSQVELWQGDGSHPSTAGTYLAACVFYATLFRQSPEGSSYQDGLDPATAQILAHAAASSVLTDPAQWGLR